MTNRLATIAIVTFWVGATGWMVWHDILPGWIGQDPPTVVAADWINRYGRESQFGIYDDGGKKIGAIWTRYSSAATTDREDDIYLEEFPVISRLHISIKSQFDLDGALDEIDISVLGLRNPVRVHGERFPSQFAFEIDMGTVKKVFKIDVSRAGTFADAFRPFDAMPDLTVGQMWHMQVMNPIAAVTGFGSHFISQVVRVVGVEEITFDRRTTECMVVETSGVKAWVERSSGLVLVQEVRLPIGGKFTVRYEPYDSGLFEHAAERFEAYDKAMRRPHHRSERSGGS